MLIQKIKQNKCINNPLWIVYIVFGNVATFIPALINKENDIGTMIYYMDFSSNLEYNS